MSEDRSAYDAEWTERRDRLITALDDVPVADIDAILTTLPPGMPDTVAIARIRRALERDDPPARSTFVNPEEIRVLRTDPDEQGGTD